MEELDSVPGGLPSLPEDVQLVLATGEGELLQEAMELAAAALVELVLLGRVGAVPETGFLARKNVRDLVVLDDRPTGVGSRESGVGSRESGVGNRDAGQRVTTSASSGTGYEG